MYLHRYSRIFCHFISWGGKYSIFYPPYHQSVHTHYLFFFFFSAKVVSTLVFHCYCCFWCCCCLLWVSGWKEGRCWLVVGGLLACSLVLGGGKKNIQSCGGRGGGERMLLFKKLQTLTHTHTIANKNIRRQNVIELVGLSAKTENNFFCYGKKKGN